MPILSLFPEYIDNPALLGLSFFCLLRVTALIIHYINVARENFQQSKLKKGVNAEKSQSRRSDLLPLNYTTQITQDAKIQTP